MDDGMKIKTVMLYCTLFLSAAFILFALVYQRHLHARAVIQIGDHARVVANSLWTFEKSSPTAYLNLAAIANGYRRIVVEDESGNLFLDISGPPPDGLERFFISIDLIPVIQLESAVIFEGNKIGRIAATWPSRAIYTDLYVLLCLLLLGTGIWLYLKLLDSNRGLEKRVQERTLALEKENSERRKTETALRMSEERFRLALEGTSDGIWDWDLRTGHAYFSPRYYTMLGYEVDEFPGSPASWRSLVHPDDLDASERAVQQAMASNLPYATEFRFRAKNGEWRWILGRGKIVETDRTGKGIRMAGSHTDITPRKLAEEALRDSETRLRAIIDNAPFGAHSFTLLADGQLTLARANRSAERILGLDHAPLIGKTIEEAFPRLAATPIPAAYRRVARDGAGYFSDQVEYNGGHAVRGAFEIHAFQTGAGRMTVFFRDITERKRAEEALRKYERIVSTSQELMGLVGPGYRFEAVNTRLLKICKLAREAVVGRTMAEVLGEKVFREKVQPHIDLAFAGRTERGQEAVELDGAGRRILEFTCLPMTDDSGTVEGVVFNARDITETRRLEEQLVQAQKIESIGTLAGGVAHEINNPINGIMNYAQLILDRIATPDPSAEFAREILNETRRVAKIVRNLLTFARHEKQSHSPALVGDIVSAVLSLIQTVMRHDQITLEMEIPAGLPKIKCRSQQIQQVLMNLMTNARDALNERYPGYSPQKRLRISAQAIEKEGRGFIRTTVADSGTGIPVEIRDRIFDPFFTTKPKEFGTGLGLSISYGIVRDHGGELSVESEAGQGTRFHMDLPVNNGWTLPAQ
jgi:PAS domain S-box-containing protein